MLMSWAPKFIERQAEGKLHLFWPPLMEAWFKQYPEHTKLNLPLPTDPDTRPLSDDELATLGAAIKARRSQLENWMRNHAKRIGGTNAGGATVSAATNSMVQRIFKLSVPKRRRVHQPIEIFQKRNKELIETALTDAGYHKLSTKGENDSKGDGDNNKGDDNGQDDDIGQDDDDDVEDWADESEDTPAARLKRTKSKRMRLRTRVVQGLWKAASAEECAAVEAEIEEEKKRLHEEELAAEQEKTPEQRQQAIDALDGVFSEVHRASHAASGWVGMSICGELINFLFEIVCFGETPSGNDFEACCLDFDKNVIQPFQDYLRLCFTNQDSADWALPSTPSMPSDERPVERVTVPSVAPPVAPVKPAAPTKAKSKKSKAKSKKSDMDKNTEPVANSSEANNSETEVLLGNSPISDVDPGCEDDGRVLGQSANDFDPPAPLPFSTPPSPVPSLWPPGMTSPLHPAEAARLACFERGGTANVATMAIDPHLEGLVASPPSSPTPIPMPRPAWKDAPTPRLPDGATLAPPAPPPFFSLPKTVSPPLAPQPFSPLPKAVAQQTPARPTAAAQSLLRILSDHNAEKTPTLLPAAPVVPAANTPVACPSSTPPLAEALPATPTPTPASALPAMLLPGSPPSASARADKAPVFPESRPRGNPLKKTSVAKPAVKRSATAKQGKTSSSKSAGKQAAAAQAASVAAKKPRGRPRKTALDDVTNLYLDPPASDSTTEPIPAPTPSTSTPALVYTSTNNNRVAARAAAAAEKEAKEKELEEARAKEAARGWTEKTVDGASVVTLTRTRKRAKLPDGSLVKPEVKGTRKKQDSCDVLLARAAKAKAQTAQGNISAGGKRKRASNAGAAPAKKRK
ncbi:hypothetical protein MSAN_01823900 [Mycena sanguinolenta]|uniref:Uncharacterized protein n=1 Tax=Mycena sanguinolenta TaxID=230812 RepID=A0A8H6XTE5_9AGAR|nr:hypothetical protein MSAN_01823900 [Mycena sanguinolenta]